MAIMAGVAKVVAAGRSGMALAGFRRDQAFGTMRETFEFDGGKGVLREQACEGASKHNDRFSHIFPRDFDGSVI